MSSARAPIAVLYHPAKKGAQTVAERLTAAIPHVVSADATALAMPDASPATLNGCTLAIVVGGDGSILGAARLCAPLGIPVLPVQLGRLGALAEIEAGDAADALPAYLRGDCYRDVRLMLTAALHGGEGEAEEVLALNEVVAARGLSAGPIRVEVTFGEVPYGAVWADGLIVATPTGSTAYTRSAGGPVVHPQVPCLSLTAVAPQSGRPQLLVVPPDETITLLVWTDAPAWALLADGLLHAQPPSGTVVTIRRAAHDTVFLRRGDRYRLQRRLRDLLTGNPRPGAGASG